MYAVLRPVVTHQLQDLEPLLEVQVLLAGHDIDALIEVVGLLAVQDRRQVAGDVQGRTVALRDECRGHAVGLQVDDLRPLGLLQQSLFLQFFDNSRHLVGVE